MSRLQVLCPPRIAAALASLLLAFALPAAASPRDTALTGCQRELRAGAAGGSRAPSLLLTDRQIASALQQTEGEAQAGLAMLDEATDAAPKRWWPIALSAVIPGLGEAVTGHRRGYFFIAGDAASWYAVKHFDDQGNDKEDDYKAFALAHWSEDEWEAALLDPTDSNPVKPFFPGLWDNGPPSSKEDVPLYVSRAEDEREWFENLGKWDIFWWGWDDGWGAGLQPGTPQNPEFDTPNRKHYTDLRGESNDAFSNRDKFLTLNLITRVLSVLDVAYLEGFIGNHYKEATPQTSGGTSAQALAREMSAREQDLRLSLYLAPRGFDETRVGLRVRY